MTAASGVHLLSEKEILEGQWANNRQVFCGFTLFKTSASGLQSSQSSYFCDLGTQQQVSVTPIGGQASAWVMTLVGTAFTYQNLADLLKRLKTDQFALLAVKTLSIAPVAVEIYFDAVDRQLIESSSWWLEWLRLTDSMGMDIGLKQASQYGVRCRLACFDMDSTLIKAEVIDELAAEAGLMAEVSAITEQAMRGELDFQHSFQKRLAMLKDLPESAVAAVLQRIELMDGAEALFKFLKANGIYTAILSGGFDIFAQQVQTQLGIDEIHANQLNFVDGLLTGQAVDPIMDAARKRFTLIHLAQKLGIPLSQALAVGDGANDLLMLEVAGAGIAFRAKPKVQAKARMVIRHGTLQVVPFFLGFSCRDSEFYPG